MKSIIVYHSIREQRTDEFLNSDTGSYFILVTFGLLAGILVIASIMNLRSKLRMRKWRN